MPIEIAIEACRSAPREVSPHAVAHQALPTRPIVVCRHGATEGGHEIGAPWATKLESVRLLWIVLGIANRVVETTGCAHDRDRPIAETVHLVETARLVTRRH